MAPVLARPYRTPRDKCRLIGQRLRARRLQMYYTQERLAGLAGVGTGSIKRLESRPWSVSMDVLVRVTEHLQLPWIEGMFRFHHLTTEEWEAAGRPPRLYSPERQRARRRRAASAPAPT